MVTEGDDELRGIAIFGILEDIQTIASNRLHDHSVFTEWLGPKSLEAWNELEKLWNKYGSLAEIIRAGY